MTPDPDRAKEQAAVTPQRRLFDAMKLADEAATDLAKEERRQWHQNLRLSHINEQIAATLRAVVAGRLEGGEAAKFILDEFFKGDAPAEPDPRAGDEEFRSIFVNEYDGDLGAYYYLSEGAANSGKRGGRRRVIRFIELPESWSPPRPPQETRYWRHEKDHDVPTIRLHLGKWEYRDIGAIQWRPAPESGRVSEVDEDPAWIECHEDGKPTAAMAWRTEALSWKEKFLRLRDKEGDDIWLWQDDGGNNPESLACPVLMRADQLREILAQQPPAATAEARELLREAVEDMLERAHCRGDNDYSLHLIHRVEKELKCSFKFGGEPAPSAAPACVLPDGVPPLPEPPEGHRWEYRGKAGVIQHACTYAYIEDGWRDWTVSKWKRQNQGATDLHYAEAVPLP